MLDVMYITSIVVTFAAQTLVFSTLFWVYYTGSSGKCFFFNICTSKKRVLPLLFPRYSLPFDLDKSLRNLGGN